MAKRINVTRAIAPEKGLFGAAMDGILESRVFTNNGPVLLRFEDALKNFLGVPHLLACSNGTQGLEIAIHAASAQGCKVITTPFTYVATVSAALWVGCDVLFADIDEQTLCINPAEIGRLMDASVKAVIPVNIYGHPCDHDGVAANSGSAKIIYDAAQAFGAELDGQSLLDFGDFAVASLHATKVMHSFEGGFVVCHSKAGLEKLRLLRAFGHIGDEHLCLGINAKMSEAHAACGLAVLEEYAGSRSARARLAGIYDVLLDFGRLRKPLVPLGFKSNFGYYPVIFEAEKLLLRAKAELEARGIFPRRYFYPALSTLPYVKRQPCPVAESVAPRVLCLPLYADLDPAIVELVAETVNDALKK